MNHNIFHLLLKAKYWKTVDRRTDWIETFVNGTCPPSYHGPCRFVHPWLSDDVDTVAIESLLVDGAEVGSFGRKLGGDFLRHPRETSLLWIPLLLGFLCGYLLLATAFAYLSNRG